jgi:hypothetical protein
MLHCLQDEQSMRLHPALGSGALALDPGGEHLRRSVT